jgi:hypothetical protein
MQAPPLLQMAHGKDGEQIIRLVAAHGEQIFANILKRVTIHLVACHPVKEMVVLFNRLPVT